LRDSLEAQREKNMGNKLNIATTNPYERRKTIAGINYSSKHNACMNNQVTSTIKLLVIKREIYNNKLQQYITKQYYKT
jgi:hypothetical protein